MLQEYVGTHDQSKEYLKYWDDLIAIYAFFVTKKEYILLSRTSIIGYIQVNKKQGSEGHPPLQT